MPRRREPSDRRSRDAITEALQLAQILRDRADALAEPFSRNDFFTVTPSEMLDRREKQTSCVDVLARLLDLGFLLNVVDLRAMVDWYRTNGKAPIPFEHLKEVSAQGQKGRRGARYVPDPTNVFAEIFGVGNDSLGVIGRQWPEAFPPSSVEGAAQEALFRSGIESARKLMQTEPERRATRVREGIEMLSAEVKAECARFSSATGAAMRKDPFPTRPPKASTSLRGRGHLREIRGSDWISVNEAIARYDVPKSTIHHWTMKARCNESIVRIDPGSRELIMRKAWLEAEMRRRGRER